VVVLPITRLHVKPVPDEDVELDVLDEELVVVCPDEDVVLVALDPEDELAPELELVAEVELELVAEVELARPDDDAEVVEDAVPPPP
jgi:hypothetical protein